MTTGSSDAVVPEGFAPIFRTSPFLDMLGPIFYRPVESGFVIGLRVDEKHGNARGAAHGGFLLTLADVALGYTAAASADPPLELTTVSMSADFVGHARIGDWVEAQVDIQRIGQRLVFAKCLPRGPGKADHTGECGLCSKRGELACRFSAAR
jgi:acyl-coenzyme A thioesterase 13